MASNPSLTIESLTKNSIQFRLRNASKAYANSLRRIIISEVPTMAVEFVKITENTSPLCDEQITHRLGLIPLSSSQSGDFNYPENCMCSEQYETCPLCSVKFVLVSENKNKEPMAVTSKDLAICDVNNASQKSVRPVSHFLLRGGVEVQRDIPIVILGQNQKLHLECVVKKGRGSQHAKWSPVAICAMKYDPIVRVNDGVQQKVSQKNRESFVEVCPRKVFAFNKQLEVVNAANCNFCGECKELEKRLNIEDLLRVEEGDFLFELETTGALPPDEIVSSAFQQMDELLSGFLQQLGSSLYATNY